MDDLKGRSGSFNLDNIAANYLFSPLMMSQGLDHQKFSRNRIEQFESPAFAAAAFDFLKSNVSFQEPQGSINLPKDDDFVLDQGNNTKIEQGTQNQTQQGAPQLEISFGNQDQAKGENQFMGMDQMRRSRGPSFSFTGRGRLDSEDLFGNQEFLNQIRQFDNQDKSQQGQRQDMPEGLLDNGFNFNQVNQSPHFLPMQSKQSANPYEFLLHPMMNQFQQQQQQQQQQMNRKDGNFDIPASVQMNQDQQGEKKSRKKKKLDANGNPVSPKRKNKNKEEFNLSQTNDKQFKMKITKNEQGGGSKSSKKFQAKNEVKQEHEGAVGGYGDDRSTEISSGLSTAMKMEDLRQRGIKNGNENLFQGMNLPPQIEEYLQKNRMVNQPQFQPQKKIGTLTVEERRIKIEKYLQKRKKRTWSKKISYDCRKRVADSRLRIKGRFVTKEQAYEMLGPDLDGIDKEKLSTSELKEMLLKKFGGGLPKKKDKNGDDKTNDDVSQSGLQGLTADDFDDGNSQMGVNMNMGSNMPNPMSQQQQQPQNFIGMPNMGGNDGINNNNMNSNNNMQMPQHN